MRADSVAVAEPHPVHHAGTEVLHHDVALLGQVMQELHGLGPLHVEADVALPAVLLREVRRDRVDARIGEAGEVADGRLDLDHLGAEVGEHAGAVRAREHAGEVEDADAVERTRACHRRMGHGQIVGASRAAALIDAYALARWQTRATTSTIPGHRRRTARRRPNRRVGRARRGSRRSSRRVDDLERDRCRRSSRSPSREPVAGAAPRAAWPGAAKAIVIILVVLLVGTAVGLGYGWWKTNDDKKDLESTPATSRGRS